MISTCVPAATPSTRNPFWAFSALIFPSRSNWIFTARIIWIRLSKRLSRLRPESSGTREKRGSGLFFSCRKPDSAGAHDALFGFDSFLHEFVDSRHQTAFRAPDDARVRFRHGMLRHEDRTAVFIRQDRGLKGPDLFRNVDDVLLVESDERPEDRHRTDFVRADQALQGLRGHLSERFAGNPLLLKLMFLKSINIIFIIKNIIKIWRISFQKDLIFVY